MYVCCSLWKTIYSFSVGLLLYVCVYVLWLLILYLCPQYMVKKKINSKVHLLMIWSFHPQLNMKWHQGWLHCGWRIIIKKTFELGLSSPYIMYHLFRWECMQDIAREKTLYIVDACIFVSPFYYYFWIKCCNFCGDSHTFRTMIQHLKDSSNFCKAMSNK